MPDYSKSKIYALRAPGTESVYIGSTCRPLSERMAQHRRHYKQWANGTLPYLSSFEMIELEGVYIELLEEYPCKTKEELCRREGQIIRDTPTCINRCIAGRTMSEYRKDNRKEITSYMRDWREARKLKQLDEPLASDL